MENLGELDEAFEKAGEQIVAICFHNGRPTAEAAWDLMKTQYLNLNFYKVNTMEANDIRDKYADGGSKPYFKFYRTGQFIDEVKYQVPWTD